MSTFDARRWVASVIGYPVADLSVISVVTGPGKPVQVRCAGADGVEVGLLDVAGPNPELGPDPGNSEVVLRLADGTFHRPQASVADPGDIAF